MARRVDRACDRFEAAWRHRPRIEDYLADCPEPERSALLRELIDLEIELRRAQGEIPRVGEYAERFGVEVDVELPPPSSRPAAGTGRYRLLDEIGRGGMGSVLRAHDPELGRELAIKLRPELRDEPEAIRRFLEEARIGGRLQHPGVVPVHDIGCFPDGRPFFTMKLIRGETLDHLLEERPDPGADLPRFLVVFEQTCQAMAYTHSEGVIHRDLKPGNIMVGAFGEIQVVDWGLAKILRGNGSDAPQRRYESPTAGSAETRPGSVFGTLAFMPPEQARGEVSRLDERADVFALGAILCTILTGEPPYDRWQTPDEMHEKARRGDLADSWRRLDGSGADAELVALAKLCLAAEPHDRPRNAGDVARSMSAYLAGVQDRLRAAEVARAEAQAKSVEEQKRRRVTLALAGSVLATLLLAGGTYLWLERATRDRWSAADREAAASLAVARHFRTEAVRSPRANPQSWARVRAEARRAEGRLEGEPGHDELRQEVRDLLAELDEEERDSGLVARLEEIASEGLEIRNGGSGRIPLSAAYAQAFREAGVDIERLPARESAHRLLGFKVSSDLVAALDDWTAILPQSRKEEKTRLLEAAAMADPDPWRSRVRDCLREGDKAGLVEIATSADVTGRGSADIRLLGRGLLAMKAYREATDLLLRAEPRHRADFWVRFQLAVALDSLSPPQYERAILYATSAIALREENVPVKLSLAVIYLYRNKQGDWEAAMMVARQALGQTTERADGLLFLAEAYLQTGRRDDAANAVRKCDELIRLYGESAPVLALRSEALRTRDEPRDREEAIASARKAVGIQDDHSGAFCSLGEALMARHGPGDVDAAIEACRKAVDLGPLNKIAHHRLSKYLLHRGGPGDRDAAIASLQEAVRCDPEYAAAHTLLARAFWMRGRPGDADAAVASSYKALLCFPYSGDGHYNLALALEQRGRPGDKEMALVHWRQAVDLDLNDWTRRYNLASSLSMRNAPGDREEAIKLWRDVLRLNPQQTDVHWRLGFTLLEEGRFAEASAELSSWLRVAPKPESGVDPAAKALEQADALGALEPRLSAVLSGKEAPTGSDEIVRFADICFRKKRFADSARLFAKALAARPELAADLRAGHRYNAPCYAARAAEGEGKDSATTNQQRSHWRRQSLTWLQAELASRAERLKGATPQARSEVVKVMRLWQIDPDLAGLRDEAALNRLPKENRRACMCLWHRVAGLLLEATRD
jgi:serine/threonine-protein kinase